jgi:hypothetical protein
MAVTTIGAGVVDTRSIAIGTTTTIADTETATE